MKNTAFRKMLSLLLCAVMLFSVPMAAYAEEPAEEPAIEEQLPEQPEQDPIDIPEEPAPAAGLTDAERQSVLNRYMNSWLFPVAEEYYDDIVDFASCRGSQEAALYHAGNSGCTNWKHGDSIWGNDGMDIRLPANAEIFAPVDGVLYRTASADQERGYAAVIEQNVDGYYSYYIILGNVSGTAPVGSGMTVRAGDVVAYASGSDLHYSAVMAEAGRGEKIANALNQELTAIIGNGWLTASTGIGMICVNPAPYTYSAYSSYMTGTYTGPITYQFVQPAPIETQPTETQPTETQPIETLPTETLPPETVHEHNWDSEVTLAMPTHLAAGQKQITCTACGETRYEEIPALAEHSFDQMVTVDAYLAAPASCAAPAAYYYSCVCGLAGNETFSSGTAGEHIWGTPVVTVQPTHTANGESTVTCTVCGASYTETIAASADHVFDQEVASDMFLASAASCASPAVYYKSCVCGQIGTETFTYGEASGHLFSENWTYNDAYHWHAAVCEHADETSDMGEHSWNAGETTVQPTHTSQGEAKYTCTVCGMTKVETLEASAEHVFDQTVASEAFLQSGATCDAPAVYYKSCICGQAGTETFTSGSALGHTFDTAWSYNDTHHWHGATCGHNEATNFAVHDWNEGKETAKAGHNVNGEKTFICTTCGMEKKEAIPGEPHFYDQMAVADKFLKTRATCTEPAVYYKSCICGEIGTETFTSGSAQGHTFAETWSSNELQHWHAATCEHKNEKSRIADHIWDFGRITTQPTATTKGVKTYTCAVCAATKTEEVQPTEHQHTFAASWTGNETYHWHAATCGHNSEVGDLGQHIWNGGVIVREATHTTPGEKNYTCLTCYATKREVVNAEHKFDRQVISPAYLKSNASCTSPAVYYYSCSCGQKGSETFFYGSSLGHTISGTWGRDANFHWSACAICGAKGEMATHVFTTYANTCSVCGYTRNTGTTTIPQTNTGTGADAAHKHISHLTHVPGRVATCTQSGNSAYYTCSCGLWFTDVTANNVISDHNSVVLAATGHVDLNKDGKCDVCKAALATQTVTYQMTEGGNTTWINTSSQGLVFRSNAEYTSFDHVEVDGKTISSLNYDVSNGSTIVELSAKYMKTLEIGKHTISIVAKDGKATADFTVKKGSAAATSGEKTSSGSSLWVVILVFVILLLLAAAGAVAYLVYFKKPRGGKFSR